MQKQAKTIVIAEKELSITHWTLPTYQVLVDNGASKLVCILEGFVSETATKPVIKYRFIADLSEFSNITTPNTLLTDVLAKIETLNEQEIGWN